MKNEHGIQEVNSNIFSNDFLKERFLEVVDTLAHSVVNTMGPYGKNALYQVVDGLSMTKDGWTLINQIKFNTFLDNSLKKIATDVPANTVLLVGDGTSTSMRGSQLLLHEILEYIKANPINTRDLETAIVTAISRICNEISRSSIKIEKNNLEKLYDDIYKIAMISSNRDIEVSNAIANIYKETGNGTIKVMDSKNDKTHYDIIEGFDLAGYISLETFFNFTDEPRFECNNPVILIFGTSVTTTNFKQLVFLANKFKTEGKTLVVFATSFETQFINELTAFNIECARTKREPINLIPVVTTVINQIDRDIVDDFSVMSGGKVITLSDTEFFSAMGEFGKVLVTPQLYNTTGISDKKKLEEMEKENKVIIEEHELLKRKAIDKLYSLAKKYVGTCETIIVDKKSILTKGFSKNNTDLIKVRKDLLIHDIQEIIDRHHAMSIITEEVSAKRIRLSKLNGKMGIIYINGYGSASLKSKKHSADDAIKACESAYNNGYNKGCSFQIIESCNKVLSENYIVDENDFNIYDDFSKISTKNIKTKVNENIIRDMVKLIKKAFSEIFVDLVSNKTHNTREYLSEVGFDSYDELINHCINNNCAFDIIMDKPDIENEIINPSDVDIEVLKSSLRLVLACATSNQLLFQTFNTPQGKNEV